MTDWNIPAHKMTLVDRLMTMAETAHDKMTQDRVHAPPLEEHDCYKAAVEIQRLQHIAELAWQVCDWREIGVFDRMIESEKVSWWKEMDARINRLREAVPESYGVPLPGKAND